LRDVVHGELPPLRRLVQPGEEATALLILRHVEEELDDRDAVARKVMLEAADVLETLLPDRFSYQLAREVLPLEKFRVDAHNQDFLVVRAIEDTDAPAPRNPLGRVPEDGMCQILGARLLEGMHFTPLRIDAR